MAQQPPTLASRAAYAQWSRKYPPYPHNPLMRVEQVAVTARTPSVTGKAMLDLACGSGRYGRLALLGGASTVFGIDNSAPMLRVGQRAGIPMHWIEGKLRGDTLTVKHSRCDCVWVGARPLTCPRTLPQ
jgi:SAM-dependent methyltransferase